MVFFPAHSPLLSASSLPNLPGQEMAVCSATGSAGRWAIISYKTRQPRSQRMRRGLAKWLCVVSVIWWPLTRQEGSAHEATISFPRVLSLSLPLWSLFALPSLLSLCQVDLTMLLLTAASPSTNNGCQWCQLTVMTSLTCHDKCNNKCTSHVFCMSLPSTFWESGESERDICWAN